MDREVTQGSVNAKGSKETWKQHGNAAELQSGIGKTYIQGALMEVIQHEKKGNRLKIDPNFPGHSSCVSNRMRTKKKKKKKDIFFQQASDFRQRYTDVIGLTNNVDDPTVLESSCLGGTPLQYFNILQLRAGA